MIKILIKNSIFITQSTYDKLLKTKYDYVLNINYFNKYNEKELEEIALQFLTETENNIYPPSIIFHEGDINDFCIISIDNLKEEEYEKLLEMKKNLIMMENLIYQYNGLNDKKLKIPTELKNIKNFTRQELLEEIKLILSLNNPISKNKENLNPELGELKSIEEILGNYILTPDNFIKMIIILLLIRENVPIILMGEPGCGKKSLIKKLSALLNNGEEEHIAILNLNDSITNVDIENFLFKKNVVENYVNMSIVDRARELEIKEEKVKKLYERGGQKYMKKEKLWIYFNRINTGNCMGLITEIMTKHTCQGKKLPESLYFIGSCYPYKLNEEADNYALKFTENKFLYSVKSLPFSLLNLVFNFGNIKKEEEEIYIKSLVENFMKEFFWKEIESRNIDNTNFDKDNIDKYLTNEENELFKNLISLSSKSIIEAHNYLREIKNNSFTAFKKIKYFEIFYEFYFEYFKNKKENENKKDICGYKKIYINSIKLSIYLCYYLALPNKKYRKYRKEFVLRMNKVFGDNFLEVPEQEKKYIANNITIEPGIAKNRMLLENLLALFACINTKIPLFIIGKPGSSKSLSVELVYKEMKGIYSENSLFKSYPKLFYSNFRGSNPEEFHKTLNLARKVLKNKDDSNKNISMIHLKEIGLYEDSLFNELNALNSEIEYNYKQSDGRIAFVGTSNFIFDYNKIEEGILLLIQPYDKEELDNTSLNIAESYNEKLANDHKDLFIALTDSYFEYKDILENQYSDKKDFHGNYDFYYLIKTAMRLQEKYKNIPDSKIDENMKKEIGIISIERNFGGLNINISNEIKPAMEIMKQNFMKRFSNLDINYKYDIKKIIYENIKDKNSRHLLLITKSSISKNLLNSILSSNELLKDSNKEISFYVGSKFIKDINSKEYHSKILNKIENEIGQNKILFLTELNELNPLLEDLFGKKYIKIGGKNYTRIFSGNNKHTYSFVNEELKCHILLDEHNLDKVNVNFLNQFEKHIISYDCFLSKEFLDEAERINNMLKDLLDMNLLKNNLDYDHDKLIININIDEIKGIIYNNLLGYQTQGKTLLIQDLQDLVLEKISLKLPKDIILSMKNSVFEAKYPNVTNIIMKYYETDEHKNLSTFLSKKTSTQNVIYTYSSIDDALSFNEDINNDLVGKINNDNI